MSQPIFVVGPQRSGTSILARTICRAEGVAGRHFNPCPRWDIPAMAELGGEVRITPWLDRMDEWLAERPERYAVVRFALPWATESFAWRKLANHGDPARFVFIYRNKIDTYWSWFGLEYLPDHARHISKHSYEDWHDTVLQIAFSWVVPCVDYDLLVTNGSLVHMWSSLGLTPPSLPDGWFHKPKHWSGNPT